ncbi:MAG: O-antigen ligase family protein [Candidatus Wallbacteria bacterium]|nr:O-antigen ligase family protein [Candidatus Wallbacteria bacterium]
MIEELVRAVLPTLFVGLAALAILAGSTVFAARRWEMLGAFLVFSLLEQQFGFDAGIPIGGRSLSPLDLLSAAALLAAGLRLPARRRIDTLDWLWVLAALVLFAAFVRGAQSYGLLPAASFYRRFFYLSAALLYALSFPWDGPDLDRLARVWIGVAAVLTGLAILGWLEPSLVLRKFEPPESAMLAFDRERVLPSSSALILAEAGLIGLASWPRPGVPGLARLLAIPFLVVMALLFHRTVWLASLAGVATLVWFQSGLAARLGAPLVAGSLAIAWLWAMRLGFGDASLSQSVHSAVAEPFQETSSFGWRLLGWEFLLTRALSDGLATVVLGAGFGVGYARVMGGSVIDLSPHNFYLELFLNAGLLGMALWVAGMLEVGRRLVRGAESAGRQLDRAGALALLVTLAVYGIPYTPTSEQGLLLGALAAAARQRPGSGA